jgi:hypothetical protein
MSSMKDENMNYTAKPYLGSNKGMKEFTDAKTAVKYLEEVTETASCGKGLVNKVEEWGWVDKLIYSEETFAALVKANMK